MPKANIIAGEGRGQAPLFKVEIPSQGKGKPARRVYCLDDRTRRVDESLERLGLEVEILGDAEGFNAAVERICLGPSSSVR